MKKSTFITFDLKPKDSASLTPIEQKHLLNNTSAWIDERIDLLLSSDDRLFKRAALVGAGIILSGIVVNFAMSVSALAYTVLSILLGSVLLGYCLLHIRMKQTDMKAATRQKALLPTYFMNKKTITVQFSKEYISMLLSSKTQVLVKKRIQEYKLLQGFYLLCSVLFAFLCCLCYQGLYTVIFRMLYSSPFQENYSTILILSQLVWIGEIVFVCFSIVFVLRKCTAYLRLLFA